MKQALPNLYVTGSKLLSFSNTLGMYSFLIARDEGNILVYGSESVEGEEDSIRDLGGVWRQYLGHSHEAWAEAKAGQKLRKELDIPVFAHEDERSAVSNYYSLDGAFSERHKVGDDFEVIPIPGHTPGSTTYLWDSGEHRVLFTADSLFVTGGEWGTALLGDSDREKYIESLELIRSLDFDVLAPWAAPVDEDKFVFTDRDDAARRLDVLIEEMRHKDPIR